MFIAAGRRSIPSPEQFQAALFDFAESTPEGRTYIKELDHEGLLKPDFKASARCSIVFVPEVRRAMARP